MNCITEHPVILLNDQNSYIKEYYNIVWQHPEATPEHWNTFLLEELHDDTIRKINSTFISRFAKPGSVLLIEGCQSLKINTTSEKMDNLFVDSAVIPPENIRGWDSVLFKSAWNLGAAMGYLQTTLIRKAFCSKMLWPLPQQMKEITSDLQTDRDEFMSKAFSEIVIPFLQEKIIPLAEKADEIRSENELIEDEDAFYDRSLQIEEQIETLRKQACTHFEEKVLELKNRIDEILTTTFPGRTQAMIETLQNVHSYVAGQGQVYLMAGALHLREHSDYQDNPAYSLKSLYDFLKDKKHIVILEPKVVTSWYSQKIT